MQERGERDLYSCLREAIESQLTGEIRHEADGVIASLIIISGEPAAAEYTDESGTIHGDTAILRFPATGPFSFIALSLQVAKERSGTARIFQPSRLFGLSKTEPRPYLTPADNTGVGKLTIQIERAGSPDQDLRIELWSNNRICAADTPDQKGKATFRLLRGTYECRVREGIRLISRSVIDFPGGDLESIIPISGDRE